MPLIAIKRGKLQSVIHKRPISLPSSLLITIQRLLDQLCGLFVPEEVNFISDEFTIPISFSVYLALTSSSASSVYFCNITGVC